MKDQVFRICGKWLILHDCEDLWFKKNRESLILKFKSSFLYACWQS